jgi:hypothetical protein
MKAEELRLGNIVEYNGVPCIVHSIQEVQCGIASKDLSINGCAFYDSVKPVQLTDEILTKWCGGTQEENGFYIRVVEHHNLVVSLDIDGNNCYNVWFNRTRIRDIFYLHELQNLLYVLTGEELKITLP